jgi:hypothetical protein
MDCSICWDEIGEMEFRNISCPSGHTFHTKCMNQWAARQHYNNNNFRSCPFCKKPIIVQLDEDCLDEVKLSELKSILPNFITYILGIDDNVRRLRFWSAALVFVIGGLHLALLAFVLLTIGIIRLIAFIACLFMFSFMISFVAYIPLSPIFICDTNYLNVVCPIPGYIESNCSEKHDPIFDIINDVFRNISMKSFHFAPFNEIYEKNNHTISIIRQFEMSFSDILQTVNNTKNLIDDMDASLSFITFAFRVDDVVREQCGLESTKKSKFITNINIKYH